VGGAAQSCVSPVLLLVYQTPREKKPSSASTRMTMRMIQRIPMGYLSPFSLDLERGERARGYGQAHQALDRRADAVPVAELHVLGRGAFRPCG
jgi:hypothetical protein